MMKDTVTDLKDENAQFINPKVFAEKVAANVWPKSAPPQRGRRVVGPAPTFAKGAITSSKRPAASSHLCAGRVVDVPGFRDTLERPHAAVGELDA